MSAKSNYLKFIQLFQLLNWCHCYKYCGSMLFIVLYGSINQLIYVPIINKYMASAVACCAALCIFIPFSASCMDYCTPYTAYIFLYCLPSTPLQLHNFTPFVANTTTTPDSSNLKLTLKLLVNLLAKWIFCVAASLWPLAKRFQLGNFIGLFLPFQWKSFLIIPNQMKSWLLVALGLLQIFGERLVLPTIVTVSS